MKVIHIENSYNIWRTNRMLYYIEVTCMSTYKRYSANHVLNRSYESMYIEWWLHNIGYYVTKPFIRFEKIRNLNERFKHVDIEEWSY